MAALCLPFVGRRSLWQDETISWAQGTVSWSALIDNLHRQDLVFAPYYGMLHVWLQIDQSEAWMRLPSLIAAVGAVWMVAALGRRLWDEGMLPGLLAGGLLAVHPSFAAWAMQARPYTLATLAVATSAWFLTVAGSDQGRARHWVGYALFTALSGYLHLFALLMLPVHVLALLAGRRLGGRAIAAIGATLVLTVPLALTIPQSRQVAWIGKLTTKDLANGLTFLTPTRLAAALLLLAVVGLVARLHVGPDQRFAVVLTVGWALIPAGTLMGISTFHPIFQDRYVTFVIPGVCLAAAGGWTMFFPSILAVRARSAVAVGLIMAACWAAPLAATLRSPYYIDDFKGLARRLDADPTARRIIASPPWVATGLAYYGRDSPLADAWRATSNGPGDSAMLERSVTSSCSEMRVVLRSDLSDAQMVAAGQGCQPGEIIHFGYLTLLQLRD